MIPHQPFRFAQPQMPGAGGRASAGPAISDKVLTTARDEVAAAVDAAYAAANAPFDQSQLPPLEPFSMPMPMPVMGTSSGRRRLREVEQQTGLGHHPNIVAIKDAWEEWDGRLYILTELCGSSLATLIEHLVDPLPELCVAKYAQDLLSAVSYIHSRDVIHLDIKPANILLSMDSSSLKIADFGQAYKIGSAAVPEEGDSRYLAPELMREVFTTAADIFSLGVTLYEMCTPGLRLPSNGARWRALRCGDIDFRTWEYSLELQQMIISMMAPEYKERPNAESLLSHPFFELHRDSLPEAFSRRLGC